MNYIKLILLLLSFSFFSNFSFCQEKPKHPQIFPENDSLIEYIFSNPRLVDSFARIVDSIYPQPKTTTMELLDVSIKHHLVKPKLSQKNYVGNLGGEFTGDLQEVLAFIWGISIKKIKIYDKRKKKRDLPYISIKLRASISGKTAVRLVEEVLMKFYGFSIRDSSEIQDVWLIKRDADSTKFKPLTEKQKKFKWGGYLGPKELNDPISDYVMENSPLASLASQLCQNTLEIIYLSPDLYEPTFNIDIPRAYMKNIDLLAAHLKENYGIEIIKIAQKESIKIVEFY